MALLLLAVMWLPAQSQAQTSATSEINSLTSTIKPGVADRPSTLLQNSVLAAVANDALRGNSDIVEFPDVNFTVPADFTGGAVQWATGETCACDTAPYNFNIWTAGGEAAFFWPVQDNAGGVSADGITYAVLEPGDTVGPTDSFILLTAGAATGPWRQPDGVDGYLGFRFFNTSTSEVNYGYAHITTSGTTGHPATIVGWAFNQAGDPITIGESDNGPMSIADARALGAGETVTVEGVVTRAMGAFTYFQDDTAGLSIRQVSGGFYDDVADGTIGTGTRVRVTGELSEFRGLMQINDGDLDEYEILGEEDEPEPQMITLEDLVDDAYQAELVHIENLTFIDAEGTFAAMTSYDLTDATIDPATVELRVPNESDTNIVGEDIPDGEFTFTGVVGSFDEPQLMAINATDVAPMVSTEVGSEVASFSLGSAYPNPVRGAARITFEVPRAEHVLIEVFDLLGQRVATLVDGQLEAAQHEVSWDAGSLANGVYLYRMQAGPFSQTLRVTVLN